MTPPIKTAVLLAAGRGKRLRPHTDHIPKPLLQYKGRVTLDYQLQSLRAAGVERVCLITHFLSEQLEAYAEQQTSMSSMHIECVRQPEILGTADALQCAIQGCPDWFSGAFLLSATDYIVGESFFGDLLNFHADAHRPEKHKVTISLKLIPGTEMSMRSSVRFDAHDHIAEIVEKPALGTAPSRYSANLCYVLPPEVIEHVHQVEASARGEREIQSAINACLSQHGPGRGLLQPTPVEWSPPDDHAS